MATNLRKMEMEKNNFIRELSREQFGGVITNKYKKVFIDYFNGNITDKELADKINKNLEMISIYENGDTGKIDSNQYLYSAIVEVALNYYNVANGFETCINKMNLLSSYFQLCAIAESKMEHLNDLVYSVFYINAKFDSNDATGFINELLVKIKSVAGSLESILSEIAKHENVISEVEKESKSDFVDEVHIDNTIKEMYVMFKDSANKISVELFEMKNDCTDNDTGAKLDIIKGKLTGGA